MQVLFVLEDRSDSDIEDIYISISLVFWNYEVSLGGKFTTWELRVKVNVKLYNLKP